MKGQDRNVIGWGWWYRITETELRWDWMELRLIRDGMGQNLCRVHMARIYILDLNREV